MITELNQANIAKIENPAFRDYASIYQNIADNFQEQIRSFGIEIAEEENIDLSTLSISPIRIENNHSSVYLNNISPACMTCRKGIETITMFISLKCPRDCYFCFNPNQENYEHFTRNERDLVAELRDLHRSGKHYRDIALSGGEPLLHKEKVYDFFAEVAMLYPKAYTRLYTSGWDLDIETLATLRDVNLKEIRFSIKMEDDPAEIEATLEKIQLSLGYIQNVMLEMPVMPDNLEEMKALLLRLDAIGVKGINLLELCFPFNNAQAFASRGYKAKHRQFRVLHNYWYAGGIPIQGSEENCLELLYFALENGLKLGIHYCSLENKQTGQIYRENYHNKSISRTMTISHHDHFLKTLKVFGEDINLILPTLQTFGLSDFKQNHQMNYLEFNPKYASKLAKIHPNVEVGLSYNVISQSGTEKLIKELKIDYSTLKSFNARFDI